MPKRASSLIFATLGIAAAFAAATFVPSGPARADETVGEKVDRLLPDLSSERDEVRERAERDLFALGEPARRELERISRDADPKRAITALRLLTRDGWDRTLPGEEKVRPDRSRRDAVPPSLREFEADLERRMSEMRRRFDEMQRRLREATPDWPKSFEFGLEDGSSAGGVSSGKIVSNDRSLAWSIDEKGRVKVTTKDGQDAPETTVEAESMEALRKEHPEVAKRLDEVSPRGGVRRWVLRFPEDVRSWNPWSDDAEPREAPVTTPGEVPLGRPALGIECGEVPEILREHLDLPEDGGLVVDRVLPETLASRLGLRRHDILLDVAGRAVATPQEVREAVESVKPGEKVTVTIVRKGDRATLAANR